MAPRLSILSPVKNAAPFLTDCLTSGQNQNFKNWEWIFVDDGSTDGSQEIITQAARLDSRIKLLANKEVGIVPALQTALNHSTGKLISRMDADDVMPANRLQILISALEREAPKTIVTGKVNYFSDKPISKGYQQYQKWLNGVVENQAFYQNIFRECVVASPNWIIAKKELLEIGGFENLNYPEDYDLVFKWYEHGFRLKGIPEVTLNWREHPNRTSRHSEHYQQEAFFKLKINRFIKLTPKKENLQLWGAGKKGRLTAAILRERSIPFSWLDWQAEKYPKGIDGHKIEALSMVTNLKQTQILLAIHPPKAEKEKLETYLAEMNLLEGTHFWYL